MIKLNNKGMTTVEILITFVIVVMLVTSLYSSVVSLKNKQTIESYRERLIAYRDLLTRDIQTDLIENGLSGVIHSVNEENRDEIIFDFSGNKPSKKLVIIHEKGCQAIDEEEISDSDLCPGGNGDIGDNYSISYGEETYQLPIIGSTLNVRNKKIYDLKIEDVIVSAADNVLDLKIILFHPDLGSRYSIKIVSPINFE